VKFVPDDFTPRDSDVDWAMTTFNVTRYEVMRQVGCMMDHEFRRDYSCWNRVFRNWMRKADEIQTLRREHKPRKVVELTEEERQIDAEKAEENLRRLSELRIVK